MEKGSQGAARRSRRVSGETQEGKEVSYLLFSLSEEQDFTSNLESRVPQRDRDIVNFPSQL